MNKPYRVVEVLGNGKDALEYLQDNTNKQLQCIILSAQQVKVRDSLTSKNVDIAQSMNEAKLSKEVKFMKCAIETSFRNVDMNKIAGELGYSKEYLYRIFRKEMGISVNNYLQNVRLEKAKEYMSEIGKYKIYEVCEMVGYEDQVYFSKLFKKKYNITPKDFQKYEMVDIKTSNWKQIPWN